jgi:hypothetical protein
MNAVKGPETKKRLVRLEFDRATVHQEKGDGGKSVSDGIFCSFMVPGDVTRGFTSSPSRMCHLAG